MKKLSQLEKTAYHEAGHATARYFLKIPFRYVTIKSEKDSYGHTLGYPIPKAFVNDRDNSPRMRMRIEKYIMAHYAGHTAECILTGRSNWKGADHDISNALDLATRLTGSNEQASAFLKWMWIRTINLIKNPLRWIAVEALAKELLIKNKIKAKEARHIIEQTLESKGIRTSIPTRKLSIRKRQKNP